MSTDTLPFGQAETVVDLPLERITESQHNPRKTFSEEALQELADSIATQGVLQPIVVRLLTNKIFDFEIVFGHRRYRAAIKAGRDTIPAIVRPMSDEQADQARLHENLEREDVHYIEEAEAMLRLMREHGVTAAQLEQQTGKKLTYVYGRLKLAGLHPKVRAACLADTFTAEVATLIARWPLAVQPAAMEACLEVADFYDEKKGKVSRSYRGCKTALRSMAVPLQRAPFDTTDATLLRHDGHAGDCTTCPSNSAADPDLAEHFSEPSCLVRGCWHAKIEQTEQREVAAAKAEGRVRSFESDGQRDGELADSQWLGSLRGGQVDELMVEARGKGLDVPQPTLLLNSDGEVVRRVYAQHAVRALQAQLFPDAQPSPGSSSGAGGLDHGADEPDENWIEQLPPEQRAVAEQASWEPIKAAMLQAARHATRTEDELRELLLEMLELNDRFHSQAELAIGWPADIDELDEPLEERHALLRGMTGADLAALLVLDMLCERTAGAPHSGSFNRSLSEHRISTRLELARRYGVNPLDPTPTPAPTIAARTPAGAAPGAAKGGGVKYRHPHTGESWSGKGLQPKWLKAAIASGQRLADFDVSAQQSSQTTPAGAGGSTAEATA
jgi:ParB/RepB/Spo0J family partition protein